MAQPVEGLKFLGVFSIALACILGTFMLRRWRGDRTMSLSLHAASHRTAYMLFAGILTFDGALFYLFLWKWFMPALKLPALFGIVLALAGICQLLAAWIPDRPGLKSKVHTISALTLCWLMVVVTLFLVFAPELTTLIRAATAIYLAVSLYFAYLYLFIEKARRHLLIYQSTFFLGFGGVILLATYVR